MNDSIKAARKASFSRWETRAAQRKGMTLEEYRADKAKRTAERQAKEAAKMATAKSLLRYSEDGQVVAVFADGSRQVLGGMDRARFEALAVAVFGEACIRNDLLGQSARPNR